MIRQTTRIIILIALCASSLTFAMEAEKAVNPKQIQSLQQLAARAVLEKPQTLTTKATELNSGCKGTLHEMLIWKVIELEILIYMKQKNCFIDITATKQKYINLSFEDLCLVTTLKIKNLQDQQLQLTINEAKLFNNLSPELKNEFAQHVIHPSLLENLLASYRQSIFDFFKLKTQKTVQDFIIPYPS
jgi:hypothetical protein